MLSTHTKLSICRPRSIPCDGLQGSSATSASAPIIIIDSPTQGRSFISWTANYNQHLCMWQFFYFPASTSIEFQHVMPISIRCLSHTFGPAQPNWRLGNIVLLAPAISRSPEAGYCIPCSLSALGASYFVWPASGYKYLCSQPLSKFVFTRMVSAHMIFRLARALKGLTFQPAPLGFLTASLIRMWIDGYTS